MNQILVYKDCCLVGFIYPDADRDGLFYGSSNLTFIHGLSKVAALDRLREKGYQFKTLESFAN